MIALPDGFALRPEAALVALVLGALALLGHLAGRPVRRWPAVLAAALGIALFGIAVFFVQTPLQLAFYTSVSRAISPFWLGANPWFLPLGIALLAALCQESARLLAILLARRAWQRDALTRLGAIVGAAVGGFEAAMVLGAIPPAALHLASLAVLERVGAVAFHTGSGALIGLGLGRGRAPLAFGAAVALHLVVDFLAAALSYGIGSLFLVEAVNLVLGLGLYIATVRWARGVPAGTALGA